MRGESVMGNAMRTFGYFVLICGIGLAGFGVYRYFTATRSVEGTEAELVAARKLWEGAKGTAGEAAAKSQVEVLQGKILEERPAGEAARAFSKWWMAGGGLVCVVGLIGIVAGKPRRRRTRGRYWA